MEYPMPGQVPMYLLLKQKYLPVPDNKAILDIIPPTSFVLMLKYRGYMYFVEN
jgi:hypothetical protein